MAIEPNANTTLTLNSLTLRNGHTAYNEGVGGYGGAIYATGSNSLVLNNTTITQNTSNGYGGAIFSTRGEAVIINESIISYNTALLRGGGISANFSQSTANARLIINNSAIVKNEGNDNGGGWDGGGLFLYRTTATIANSTISNNKAEGGAEAPYFPVLTLSNTVIANTDNDGGNFAAVDCSSNIAFPSTSTSNWMEDADEDLSCFNNAPVPASIQQGDPSLGALEFKEATFGPTAIHSPLAASPLIGAGDVGICAGAPINGVDQLGAERSAESCAIGASELPEEEETFFVVPIGPNKTVTFSL